MIDFKLIIMSQQSHPYQTTAIEVVPISSDELYGISIATRICHRHFRTFASIGTVPKPTADGGGD